MTNNNRDIRKWVPYKRGSLYPGFVIAKVDCIKPQMSHSPIWKAYQHTSGGKIGDVMRLKENHNDNEDEGRGLAGGGD